MLISTTKKVLSCKLSSTTNGRTCSECSYLEQLSAQNMLKQKKSLEFPTSKKSVGGLSQPAD